MHNDIIERLRDTFATASEVERDYELPKGTIRRDIHRGHYGGACVKLGRNWLVLRDAVRRRYGVS